MHNRGCISANLYDRQKAPSIFFLNTDEVKFLKNATWLRGTRAARAVMSAVPALAESEWYFSFAKMNSCVVVVNFAMHKAEVKHLGCSVLGWSADVCDLPSLLFEKLGAPSSFL